ncbi:unnamed protein product [Gordionus sp. m RMFG-2023]
MTVEVSFIFKNGITPDGTTLIPWNSGRLPGIRHALIDLPLPLASILWLNFSTYDSKEDVIPYYDDGVHRILR